MRKISSLSITLALVTTQLLTINLVSPANAAEPKTPVTLTLMHNNDGESSLGADAIYKTKSGDLKVGSTSAFATVFDREIADARQMGNAVLSVYAGDSFLPSKNMICSEPGDPKSQKPVLDAAAQAQMPYDVHILGNHEFDYGTGFLSRYIKAFGANGKPKHPFISGNLDFSKNSDLKSMVGKNTLSSGAIANGKVLGRSYVHTDPVTKHRFGVVSAVTWGLRTISSPGSVKLTTNDLQSTAKAVQAQIDTLQRMGINKIILVSHLQAASNDKELVALLKGVDIAVAGGGDELLQNSAIEDAVELIPGESTPVGEYPTMLADKAGNEVPLVTTSGNYKYLGRADLFFDEKGNLDAVNPLTSYPRRVVPVSTVSTAAGITDAVTPKESIVKSVDTPLTACLAGFTAPIAASNTVFNTDRGSATVLGVRTAETNGGNLVADAFVYSYNQRYEKAGLPKPSTTTPLVGVQNGGGIRQNPAIVLPVTGKVGEITRGNTFDLLPFGNTLVAVTNVSPKELKEIFERSCSISTSGGGQFLQISGMKVVCLRNGTAQVVSTPASGATVGSITTEGTRVKSITLTDGRAIVSNGALVAGAPSVTMVTNNFTADGGDNYPALAALKKSAFGIDYEVSLYEYLRTFPAGAAGLATIPDTDARYKALTGEGRFTWE
jgi:2',3'-cyclic-nucleotide 2'-phosphodiesterase (5'-nucleotidase family)